MIPLERDVSVEAISLVYGRFISSQFLQGKKRVDNSWRANFGSEMESVVQCLRAYELVWLDCQELYRPNRVAMQFGYDQVLPKWILLNALNRTRYKQKGRGSRCPVSESGGPGGRRAPWPGGPGGRRRPRADGIQCCCIGPLIFCWFSMLGPSLLGRSLALYIDAMGNPIL